VRLLIVVYVGLSLVLGGIAATAELSIQPTMLDRADGRGKFASPRAGIGEALWLGVFVTVLWPYLLVALVVDVVSPSRRRDREDDSSD
jgi:hypothetical protein